MIGLDASLHQFLQRLSDAGGSIDVPAWEAAEIFDEGLVTRALAIGLAKDLNNGVRGMSVGYRLTRKGWAALSKTPYRPRPTLNIPALFARRKIREFITVAALAFACAGILGVLALALI